jgi:hypothetical protein
LTKIIMEREKNWWQLYLDVSTIGCLYNYFKKTDKQTKNSILTINLRDNILTNSYYPFIRIFCRLLKSQNEICSSFTWSILKGQKRRICDRVFLHLSEILTLYIGYGISVSHLISPVLFPDIIMYIWCCVIDKSINHCICHR